MTIERLIKNAASGIELTPKEIGSLFEVPLFSPEAALIQVAARKKSETASLGLAEVHAQVGLNIAPCARNCRFCSFAACNEIFTEALALPMEEIVAKSSQFEADGANAVYLMSTAHYPFTWFIEAGQEVRRALKADTVLVANVGDFDSDGARRLKDAGFDGIYHAVRMGEGEVTDIPVEARLRTFQAACEAQLLIGTCVEPVGPEHSTLELVEKTIINRNAQPVFSGSARRIPIPGTTLGDLGAVTEARMAHILAVVRLAVGALVTGNCTHEPNVIGAAAGANLFWAETGSNPRDIKEDTEGQRGMTVADCRQVLKEAQWKVLDGPSLFFQKHTIT